MLNRPPLDPLSPLDNTIRFVCRIILIMLIGLAIAALLSGCALLPKPSATPASLTKISQIRIREEAGIYNGDWTIKGSSHEAYYARLVEWAKRQNIIVAVVDLSARDLQGSTQPGYGGIVILLEQTLTPNGRLETLLHELAHVYSPQKTWDDDGETIAEIVSGMVCERLGLDVWPQITSYLVLRVPSPTIQVQTIQRYGARIDAMVDRLTAIAKGESK